MKTHIISLQDIIEPVQTIHHILVVEFDEEEYEIKIEETIYNIRDSNFEFSDIETVDWLSEEIGYGSTDEFLDACVNIIYKNGE